MISGGVEIALARTPDLQNWEHTTAPLVPTPVPWSGANFRDENVRLSEFLGIRRQAAGDFPDTAEHKEAAGSMRSSLAHPEVCDNDLFLFNFLCRCEKRSSFAKTGSGQTHEEDWI